MTSDEALQLVDQMKKRGVLEFSYEGLTVKLHPASIPLSSDAEYTPPPVTPEQKAALERNPKPITNPADEDLYWSI